MIGKITTLRLLCDRCGHVIADNCDDYDPENPKHIPEDEMLREALENGYAHLCGAKLLCDDCYTERCEKKSEFGKTRTVSVSLQVELPYLPEASDDDAREYLRYRLVCGAGCRGTNPYFSADIPPFITDADITDISLPHSAI